MTRQPMCIDRRCPMAGVGHEAHDNRHASIPAPVMCRAPRCPLSWVEHEAHPETTEREAQ